MPRSPGAYHAHDEWFFQPDTDGGVTITTPSGNLTVTPDVWASIVAFVSHRGDTAERWSMARRFHMGAEREASGALPPGGVRAILRHFRADHLPPHLRVVSQPCGDLAWAMVARLPVHDPQLLLGLTDLLRAKDCFVRAALTDDPAPTS